MRRKIAPILWVVMLGAVAVASYGWYFLGQRQRIADLNQRELGRAAENLRSILQNAVVNVSNLTTRPEFACKFLKRQPYLVMPQGTHCEDITEKARQKPAPACIRTGDNGLTIAAGDTLEFGVDLEKILDELVVGHGFEYLFVANQEGNVLFQTRRGERKRWLDKLHWADQHARDESVKPASPLRLRNISELAVRAAAGLARADDKPNRPRLTDTTESLPVEIAGEDYRLYLQPLGSMAKTAAGSDAKQAIVLGGLVNGRESVSEALAVDPRLGLALAVLAGLALLTWPLLKLMVLAPSERFKFVDFYLLLLSASALLSIGTVIALDFDNYGRLEASRRDQLKPLADKLAAGLVAELSGATRQLAEYDAELARKNPMDCDAKAEGKRLFTPTGEKGLQVSPPRWHQHMITAFWSLGADGKQFAKVTTLGANTPFIDVSSRPYFVEVRNNHLWGFRDDVPGARSEAGFYVQTYRSMTTGDFETGIAMPSQIRCEARSKDSPRTFDNVAVLTTTLASLYPKALPDDYGFLMTDRSGRVLYHSEPRLALREDLFEEVGDPERLRALVIAEREGTLRTGYQSVPHELFIRPLGELVMKGGDSGGPQASIGWFIVTFRNLRLTQTVNTEAGLTALIWCVFYFVPMQFALALILVLRGPAHSTWIWPTRDQQRLYRGLALKLAMVAAAVSCAVSLAQGWWLPAFSCLGGVAGPALAVWEHMRWRAGQAQGCQHRSDVDAIRPAVPWQPVALVLFLILVSVFPAAGLFRFAWNQEIGTLLAYDSKHVSEASEDLKLQVLDHARDKFADVYGQTWEKVVRGAIAEQNISVWDGSLTEGGNKNTSVDVLARWKPVYNDAAASLRYERSRPDLAEQEHLAMRPGLLSLLAGLLFFGTLLRGIRYVDRHLFLVEFARLVPANVVDEIYAAREERRNLIIVTSSCAQEDAIRALLEEPVKTAVMAGAGGCSEGALVCERDPVFRLTDSLRSAESRLEGLAAMEQIAASGSGVVLSRVDPVVFFFQGDPAAFEEHERGRWGEVLERFSIVLAPLPAGVVPEGADREAAGWPERRSFFWSLWNACSAVEKVVLVHVAEEGFANPRQTRTVERLLRRGLLVFGPNLRLFHPDFQAFVEEVYDRKAVAAWEQPGRGIGWTQARWIVTIAVVTVALFLLGTQRQALTPVVSFVSTLTGAFVGIIKLISEINPKKRGAE